MGLGFGNAGSQVTCTRIFTIHVYYKETKKGEGLAVNDQNMWFNISVLQRLNNFLNSTVTFVYPLSGLLSRTTNR